MFHVHMVKYVITSCYKLREFNINEVHMQRKTIFILALFLSFKSFALSGNIIDENGINVSDAIISFHNKQNNKCYVARTNENGSYQIGVTVPIKQVENNKIGTTPIQNSGSFLHTGPLSNFPLVEIEKRKELELQIFSVNGRLIKQINYNNESIEAFSLNLHNSLKPFSKGLYLYKFNNKTTHNSKQDFRRIEPAFEESIPVGDYTIYITGKNIRPYLKDITIDGQLKEHFTVEPSTLWDDNRVVLRSNYNNSRKKILDGFIRIAFLGGSITNMTGWRTNIMNYFETKFPSTKFEFIEAGIGGKGSKYHAFRLQRDVFHKGKVDLLFLESAVNDRGLDNKIKLRAHEGIIRQARQINPEIDIVQLHFLYKEYYDIYNNFDLVPEFAAYDSSGKVYNASMQNLARHVAEQYSWQEFGSNVHPKEFGHKLYSDNIEAMFTEAWIDPLPQNYQLFTYPMPIETVDSFSYINGHFKSIDSAFDVTGFQKVESYIPSQGTLQSDWKNMQALVGTTGNKLKFKFSGTLIGVEAIHSEYTGDLKFNIDNGMKTGVQSTRFGNSKHKANSFIFDDELPQGEHIIELEVDENSDIVILNFLVNSKE